MARTPLFSDLTRLARGTRERSTEALSRRELIQVGLCASIAPMASGCEIPLVFGGRTVVVGAGIAGLHCAWRLAEADVEIVVYEAQDRLGGRMFTDRASFGADRPAELGGEFIDTGHLALHELATEFNILLDDRVAEELPGMIRDTWWIGGAAIDEAIVQDQFAQVAPAIEADFFAAEGSDVDYERLDLTPMSTYLDQVAPAAQHPELNTILSVAYRGEYGLETHQQSALNLVYLIDAMQPDPFRIFGDSDERYHAHDGNDTFTTALADAIGHDRIALQTRLVAVRDCVLGGYEIELEDASGGSFVDYADHVVFAIPFTKLREIPVTVRGWSADKQDLIDTLGYGTNAKVIGGFAQRPWWDDFLATGSCVSDLPFQQVWDSTLGQSAGGTGILTNYLGGDEGLASDAGTALDQLRSRLPDLDGIWPGVEAAFEDNAVRMHWPTHPWSLGSYTCYTPGQWASFGEEGRRVGNLHFCGEHTSLDFQGWMEGGAETGALVAAEILDDLERAMSIFHARIVSAKTLAPQACYHGDRLGRLRPLARRRALSERIEALRR